MKALFVSELGAGYGNVAPLVRVAEMLASEKIEPVFALSDGVAPAWMFKDKSWLRLPAPLHPEPLKPKAGPASYGDILALSGFADPDDLAALVSQWDALFALVKPAFVVASHAPTALLAARGRLKAAAIGTGFTLPPHHTAHFPALRPDTASFRTEASILAHLNALLTRRGAPKLATLPALLDVDARLVSSIPALDPYAQLRLDPYYMITPMERVAPPNDDAGVFAFLDMRGKEAANAVEALAYLTADTPLEAHIRGPGALAAMALLKRRGAIVHQTPPPMHEVLSRSAAVLSQGGHGVSWAALRAGRPHVVMPIHFESMLNGIALERLGVGKVAWGGAVETMLDHMGWALDQSSEKAQAVAFGVQDPPVIDPQKLLQALGVTRQRRGKPGASSASPKRGQKRQDSAGATASSR